MDDKNLTPKKENIPFLRDNTFIILFMLFNKNIFWA